MYGGARLIVLLMRSLQPWTMRTEGGQLMQHPPSLEVREELTDNVRRQ